MDDEVVFQNSALHRHLQSVGFNDDDVSPEDVPTEVPEENPELDDIGSRQYRGIYDTKVTFWTQLKSSVSKAFWDEAWNDQLTQVHNKHADELTDLILQNPVLEEEDGMYIESFYTSMQSYRPEIKEGESSIMGVVMMQMAVLSVSLAYAGFRMVYLRSPDLTSRYYIWSIDIIAVLLTIASLTPTTLKSACAGRSLNRLNDFSKTGHDLLKEVDSLYRLNKRSLKLVQEMELVSRGFTMITPVTPVARLEQGGIQPSRRQCPKLRRLVFHSSRSLMLNVKRSSQHLLRNFPPHVEIDGLSSYLANQPLHHYGPCVYISGDSMENKLRAVTEDYSLASIKAMVELCNIHISEFLRVLAMSCLTQAEEHEKNPSYRSQKQIIETLRTKFQEQLKPLTKLYTLHKSLTTAREKKEKEHAERKPNKQTPTESLFVAVHSLSLHMQAAQSRISKLEADLEGAIDSQGSKEAETKEAATVEPSEALLSQLTAGLGLIKSELDACQDCVDESQLRAGKLSSNCSDAADSSRTTPASPANKETDSEDKPPPIPLFEMGDPIVQDQVFQAYTDDVEADMSYQDQDCLLSDEERAKKKQEKREAIRVLKELRKVIAVRAVEHEERERQALLRQYPDAKFEDPIVALRKQSSRMEQFAVDRGSIENDLDSDFENNPDKLDTIEECTRGDEQHDFETGNAQRSDTNSSAVDSGFEGNTIGLGELGIGSISMSGLPNSAEGQASLKVKLAGLGGANFPFSNELAAQAVARSQQMAALSEETFGDEEFGDEPEDLAADGHSSYSDDELEVVDKLENSESLKSVENH